MKFVTDAFGHTKVRAETDQVVLALPTIHHLAATMSDAGGARLLTAEQALAFVQKHGVVLASAKGPAPRLVEAIVGEPIRGSWWAHARSRQIYGILQAVTDSDEVLVCRLLDGKITLVHRRLWPPLVRLAERFAPEQLAAVRDEHTSSGRHMRSEVAFPQWVPAEVAADAKKINERKALAAFGAWLPR